MKKIALLFSLIVILGCSTVLSGCYTSNDSESYESTPEALAKEAVRGKIAAKLLSGSLGDGTHLRFSNCTFSTTTHLGNNNFKISGTVRARDDYGNFHTANYDAYVEYNAESDYYSADVSLGQFSRQ
ncbi:MAG: hypothetical protein IKB38_00150 [Clostridia bacterium]|nr:hypothetical protein [Clostridia bacterium]